MATNKSIRAIARAANRLFDSSHAIKNLNVATGTLVLDIDDRQTQIALAANKHNFVRVKDAGTFTVTLATPGVFTFNSHGFVAGDIVQFTTTGALPTGLTAGTNYYVIATGLTANNFQVSATFGGTGVATSVSQSGTHTVTCVSASIIGLTRYGFRIPATSGVKTWVKLGNLSVTIVDTTSGEVRRILRRTYGEWIASTSVSTVGIRGISDTQLNLNVYVPTVATSVLTGTNAGNATDTKIVTIGGRVYTLQSVLTNVDGHVKIAASADLTLTNLANAINATGGVAGTDYAAATTANPVVTSSALGVPGAHQLTLTTILTGDRANAVAPTTNEPTYSATAFIGGNDGASAVSRNVSVTALDPRTPANYGVLRRQFKHYVEL